MSEFVRKTAMGNYKAVSGGYSDPECTHVISTIDEYDSKSQRIKEAENNAKNAELDAKEKIESMRKHFNLLKKQLEDDYIEKDAKHDSEIAEWKAEVELCKLEIQRQENLNKNLKRIALERANQKRGVLPKRTHDGYIVLFSHQYKEKWKTEITLEEWRKINPYADKKEYQRYEHHEAKAWKSAIQTPYDASIPLEVIEKTIMEELWHDENAVLPEIGCNHILKEEFNGKYRIFTNKDGHEDNGMYKWSFSANYKSGFWEMIVFTTKELVVPAGRRPV